jgi:FSR family fosmidomycin resistance protein-like MFS transporter
LTLAKSVPATGDARSDVRTTSLIGSAHFTSHFLMLAPAPLLPLMKAEFDVSFTQLGLILTVFFATSGVGQVVAGILVDRFGPHRLLLSGVALQAVAVAAMGFAPHFLLLFPLAFFAGLGNTVYHPSDLSILSRRVTHHRQGKAFATHSMAGTFGFAISPVAVGLIATQWGWRVALISAGILGLIVAASLLLNRSWLRADDFHPHATSESERNGGPAVKLNFFQMLALPVVMFGFGFFFLTALAGASLMNFTVSALTEGYGVTLAWATVAIAAYQIGAIGGTLVGGLAADRWPYHHRIAIVGVIVSGLLTLPVIYTGLPLVLIIGFLLLSGVFGGATLPSRDLLIRQTAPRGNLGKTFGMVYSGLDGGSLIGPLVIGPMLDRGEPQLLFLTAAVAMGLATFTVLGIRAAQTSS